VINVKTRRENVMPKFKDFVETTYTVPMIKREINRKINPKTNRMKNFKKIKQLVTNIPPEKRTFKNLPKYADGKSKVRFQDWLLIKGEKISPNNTVNSIGKSEADGKWYGWSHRAVYGFKAGDEVKGDNMGKKVIYPKLPDGSYDFDNPSYEDDFIIKDDSHAREVAITFAKNVS
jgi:hypothetical protein